MAFFNSQAITVLQTLVIALGAGLGVWGGINLLEGYGQDNPEPMLMCRKVAQTREQIATPLFRKIFHN